MTIHHPLSDKATRADHTALTLLVNTKPAEHRRTIHEHVRYVHQARRFSSFPIRILMFWRLGLLDVPLLGESLGSSALLFGKHRWATTVLAYPVSRRAWPSDARVLTPGLNWGSDLRRW